MRPFTASPQLTMTMTAMRRIGFRLIVQMLGGLACFAGGVALAQSGVQLAMLDRLDPGMWELRVREGGKIERLCLDDGRRLI
jgi:hypothetical protein